MILAHPDKFSLREITEDKEKRCIFLSRLLGFSRDRIEKLCSIHPITRESVEDAQQIFLLHAELSLRRFHQGHRISVATWCINRGVGAVKDWIRQETRVRAKNKVEVLYFDECPEALHASLSFEDRVLSYIEMDKMTHVLPKNQKLYARNIAFGESLEKLDIFKHTFRSREYHNASQILTQIKAALKKKLNKENRFIEN